MSNVPEVTIGKLSDTFAQPHRVSCPLKYPEILFVLDPNTGLWRFQTTHATPTLAQEAAEILLVGCRRGAGSSPASTRRRTRF